MARPTLSWDEKWARMQGRFMDDLTQRGPGECWPLNAPRYYKMGTDTRFRPLALAYMLFFPDKELPEPRHMYWIGNKDTCTVEVCGNPEHLEVKSNEKQVGSTAAVAGGVVGGFPLDGQGWIKAPDGEKRLAWVDREKKERYQALPMEVRPTWPKCDGPAPVFVVENGALVPLTE